MKEETNYWKINNPTTGDEYIQLASELLKQGEVVAFPTETVYGLGADARNQEAVAKIFKAKGRPSDNPLIVHVANREQMKQYVTQIPDVAHRLIERFTPGPLTIILESNQTLAKNVTAGLSTVGIRIPDHPVALALLQACNLPLAAPSANQSGKPSPTTANHVYEDLNGRIAALLDGGPTSVGVESTVIDCTGEIPVILRPGGITKEDIESLIGPVMVDPGLADESLRPRSPGMKYTHYAPEVPLYLVQGDAQAIQNQIDAFQQKGKKVAVIVSKEYADQLVAPDIQMVGSRNHLEEVARHLYDALRHFKEQDFDVILCESFPYDGVGQAIMNRLTKAATKQIG
ncbi:threonylcarbamoyl-AMP synthase [Radiobacillus kanasensis]|uniref:L-threonylcarbamoyladenylate synthase n=1 Tax=Radiobacillus kanasensis TaxID=2844358 RepID=UPI001E4559D5|nr:L-threonylcarbamoyladenylate synthase [Radiobacillus kanasensis]UFT98958.1 threonylcarbamoyl-AMP synthase [Radiobacillus kanasensis]